MPRKTRRQYRKKNKRGGMSHSRIVSAINEGKKGISNTRDNVTRKARGFLSKFSNFFGSKKKQTSESKPLNEMPSRQERPAAEAGPAARSAARPAAGSTAPGPAASGSTASGSPEKGGKRKSRRFRKKKGKVTLQGGRRRRSRKSIRRRR